MTKRERFENMLVKRGMIDDADEIIEVLWSPHSGCC